MHEVRWRLDRISNRRNQDVEFDAKLHGFEVKTPKPKVEAKPLDESRELAMDKALQEAKERKAKEYGR